MARAKPQKNYDLHPDRFYRWVDGPYYFGYGRSQQRPRVDSGDIPKPISLADNGRALGWFGWQIIGHRNKLEAKSALANMPDTAATLPGVTGALAYLRTKPAAPDLAGCVDWVQQHHGQQANPNDDDLRVAQHWLAVAA